MASKKKLTRAEILAKARAAKKLIKEDRSDAISQRSDRIRGRNTIRYGKSSPTTHQIHEMEIPAIAMNTYKSYAAFNIQLHNNNTLPITRQTQTEDRTTTYYF